MTHELAESFVQSLRNGEEPSIEEYVERQPQLSEDIRRGGLSRRRASDFEIHSSKDISRIRFSADGQNLLLGTKNVTYVWNLKAVGKRLAEMNLDWQ